MVGARASTATMAHQPPRHCLHGPGADASGLLWKPNVTWTLGNRIWSGNNTVDTIVTYECVPGMETEEGTTYQTRNCTTDGWTPPPLPCDPMCKDPIPDAGNSTERNMTSRVGWRLPGATVEYLCSTGAVQTVTCTGSGWEPEVLPPCCSAL
ncbi:hypothetical protein FJT64_018171 [Amphibalanus amphitrite]|uniref:Sushi domain-containing protein n=1 Tax=Amphibalanus amphitrite TaxID=1232801 RepID=A0A6A4X7K1_AMPAM|nr:hypothetical protein FJT64_018171 [Amphibalanus amphitrite]